MPQNAFIKDFFYVEHFNARAHLTDENAVIVGASKVFLALNDAIILADGIVQDYADPFAGGELRGPDEGYRADRILARDLHTVAHLHSHISRSSRSRLESGGNSLLFAPLPLPLRYQLLQRPG